MAPTEHQREEWVAAIKREFPRLAAQDFVVRAMVDVYAEDPGFIHGLQKKAGKEKKKNAPPAPKPATFESGVIEDAVKISAVEVKSANANADAAADSASSSAAEGAEEGRDRPARQDSVALPEQREHQH